ncbi:hypothetical protein [Paraburkholderia aspalathi]|uniref:hypothetical protein n=1 Tax=Paraburkholderia aspalathi TaxID=1324617 RepID=UPI001B161E2C|nr:hypothetical protein [Paraburkholderia aspalathi]CAE6790460.1 hypothetical protein R20943_04734 [Paraburkholderia aspalathi]
MAYDLRRIAPEREVPPFRPAWPLWAFLFLLIVGGGAFGVVRFWPAGESTQTVWFWTCVAAFPVLVWTVLLFSYLGVLQSRRTCAEEHNEARREYKDEVCRRAGIPLHILDSGFVFSAREHENTASAVVERQLTLEPKTRFDDDSEAIAARWIDPDGYAWRPGDEAADEERHRDVLGYVFGSLLRQIAPAVRALPERTRLIVRVSVAAQLTTSEIEAIWHDSWDAHQLGNAALTAVNTDAPDLIAVDGWLDGAPGFVTDAVNVLCVVQLNPLLNAIPDAGVAEAGAILMFASRAFVAQRHLASNTLLYRPEHHDEEGMAQGLLQVLLWSRSRGSEVNDQWLIGGTEAPLQRELSTHMDTQDVGVLKTAGLQGQHDVDLTIGTIGMAAPWLCVALASAQVRASGQKQLLSIAHVDHMTLAVVGPQL